MRSSPVQRRFQKRPSDRPLFVVCPWVCPDSVAPVADPLPISVPAVRPWLRLPFRHDRPTLLGCRWPSSTLGLPSLGGCRSAAAGRSTFGCGCVGRPFDLGLRLRWRRPFDLRLRLRLGAGRSTLVAAAGTPAVRPWAVLAGGFVSSGSRFTVCCCGCSGDRATLGLASTLRSGLGASYICGGAWSLPSSATGLATIGDLGSLTLAGANSLRRLLG